MIIYILVQTISVGNPLNQDGYCSRLSFTSTEGFVTNVNIKRKVNVRNITITNHVTEIVWITPAPTTTTSTTTSNFQIYLGVKKFLHLQLNVGQIILLSATISVTLSATLSTSKIERFLYDLIKNTAS